MMQPTSSALEAVETAPDAEQRNRRRQLIKSLSLGTLAGCGLSLTAPGSVSAANASGKAKVVFVLFRRPDLTHEQSLAEWKGNTHVALVRKVPGLQRWVQNHPTAAPAAGLPDGIGELWFADAQSMSKGMSSPEMAAAGEDARRFLDMEKTFALIVVENALVG
jgi:uncharacterized protein (TIGR02118 family)